jgi:hypothetical protein
MPFDLTKFLNKWFPSLDLSGGLFYDWPIGIRLFEFALAEGIGLADPEGALEVRAAQAGGDDLSHTLIWVEQSSRSFRYREVLRGIANCDHAITPSIGGRVYFLNPRSHLILHMYDDRGLDVVAADKSSVAALYEGFNGWILDYDRARIDLLFQS